MSNPTITLNEADYLIRLVFEGEGYITETQAVHVTRELMVRREAGEATSFGELAVALGVASGQDLRYSEYLIGNIQVVPGRRKPLGYFILEGRWLKPTQLLEALEEQAQLGGRLGEIAVRNGWMTDAQLAEVLALQQATA